MKVFDQYRTRYQNRERGGYAWNATAPQCNVGQFLVDLLGFFQQVPLLMKLSVEQYQFFYPTGFDGSQAGSSKRYGRMVGKHGEQRDLLLTKIVGAPAVAVQCANNPLT